MALTYGHFLSSLPAALALRLPADLQGIQSRQPWRWLVQFHFGEPRLHYEVSRVKSRPGLELGFHCEARDADLNRYLLLGFRKHLAEIKDTLGDSVEAEMWDKGWTKVYEVLPEEELTAEFQGRVAGRLAALIVCLHPIFVDLRNDVREMYR
jgi:hypothetical protein